MKAPQSKHRKWNIDYENELRECGCGAVDCGHGVMYPFGDFPESDEGYPKTRRKVCIARIARKKYRKKKPKALADLKIIDKLYPEIRDHHLKHNG